MATSDTADMIVTDLASKLQAIRVLVGTTHAPKTAPSSSPRRGPTRWLFPAASYGLDIWRPGDDVDLVLVTDNSRRTFFDYVAEVLSIEPPPSHNNVNYLEINDSIKSLPVEQIRNLAEEGSKVRLHYASKLPGFEKWAFGGAAVPDLATQNGNPTKLGIQGLQLIADTLHVSRAAQRFKDKGAFATAYSRLQEWSQSYAIWGADFGFLDAECLTHMLCAAVAKDEQTTSADAMVQRFITFFCGLELSESLVKADGAYEQRPKTDGALPMVVTTSQHRNAASCIDADGARLIQDAITRTAIDPEFGLERTIHDAFADFQRSHDLLVVVDAIDTHQRVRTFAVQARQRFVSEIVRQATVTAQRKIHEAGQDAGGHKMQARVWPAPITFDHPPTNTFVQDSLRLTYLIGVTQAGYTTNDSLATLIKAIRLKLSVLETEFFAKSTLLDVSIRLSGRHDNETQALRQIRCKDSACCQPNVPELASLSPAEVDEPVMETRFRTVKQAINRLRWDPNREAREYEVGWVDRFDGMKWTALLDWGKATEEEDFIPEHRVWQIRRKDDGTIVWDRKHKADAT